MKKPNWTTLFACVALSTLLVIPDVYAQFGGGGMGGGMGGPRQGERPGKGCDDGKSADAAKRLPGQPPEPINREQLAYRLNTLQVDLHLKAEQAAAWQAFAERVLALESDQERLRARPAAASAQPHAAGTVKSVANAVDQSRNRLAALEDIETASRNLYQILNPEQQVMADLRLAEVLGALLRS